MDNIENNQQSDLRVLTYVRCSPDNQISTSVEDQIKLCKEWAQRNSLVVHDKDIFYDDALTGKLKNRENFDLVVEKIQAREYDLFLVYDTSCIYRNATQAHHFKAICNMNNVRIVGVTDGLGTAQFGSNFHYSMLSAHNEFTVEK